jgi:hypothetical protein
VPGYRSDASRTFPQKATQQFPCSEIHSLLSRKKKSFKEINARMTLKRLKNQFQNLLYGYIIKLNPK